MLKKAGVAILGLGVVGGGPYEILTQKREYFKKTQGVDLTVEAVLEKSPYFAEVCVLGVTRSFGAKDGTEEVAAVVVPREDFIEKNDWETVEKTVREEVKKLSLQLTQYKRPSNITIHREPLPKTTTRKVKRKEVKELVKA